MEDSTGIKISFFRTQLFLNVLTHCGFGITSRDECWKRGGEREIISEFTRFTQSQLFNRTQVLLYKFSQTNLLFKSIPALNTKKVDHWQ